ncbi:RHS repeat-associated core domain-containing protein [Micromonospora sp. RTGN7]|uniref:RHS repeat-associated core domain-containing protein n=1 Tax=Micromonospora sp. RTGN7 TaxID=3016526 RepID=UPI0029FF0C8C|nr:RHS repeat-associated core domain-containing protein [Micromonospora sp. RTGN7]
MKTGLGAVASLARVRWQIARIRRTRQHRHPAGPSHQRHRHRVRPRRTRHPRRRRKANGTLAATYKYDPYGNATTTDETNLGTTNLIRYTGGTYDQSTGFTKLGQRWYNPQQGRFTQQDNLSFIGNPQHGNRYAYAGGNPINYVDPSGNSWTAALAGGLLGAVAGMTAWGLSGGNPIVAGAVGGGVAGFAQAAIGDAEDGGPVDWGNAAAEGLIGAGLGAGLGYLQGLPFRPM